MSNLDLECLRDSPKKQTGDHDHDMYGNNPGQDFTSQLLTIKGKTYHM